MSKLEVGMLLYYENQNRRHGEPVEILETKITKVGNKYYTTKGFTVEISTMRSKSDFRSYPFYAEKKELEQILETRRVFSILKTKFNVYTCPFTLSQLQRINAIINE